MSLQHFQITHRAAEQSFLIAARSLTEALHTFAGQNFLELMDGGVMEIKIERISGQEYHKRLQAKREGKE